MELLIKFIKIEKKCIIMIKKLSRKKDYIYKQKGNSSYFKEENIKTVISLKTPNLKKYLFY